MAHVPPIRRPPIVILPPNQTTTAPATLFFIHGYNDVASNFANNPPDHLSIAHHIHKSPSLQHIKIVVPEALPCIHPSIRKNVWYNPPMAIPPAGNPATANEHVEFGHSENNRDDMNVTLDYFEELIGAEIANGTPASRIVFMGYSQGAGMVVLFLQTRRIAADLGAVISQAGFPPTDLQSVFGMQREHGLVERWSKQTRLFLMQGKKDVFVPVEIFWSWQKQLDGFRDRGQGVGSIEWRLIDGVGHAMHERVWHPVREILESNVPERMHLKL